MKPLMKLPTWGAVVGNIVAGGIYVGAFLVAVAFVLFGLALVAKAWHFLVGGSW